MQSIFSLNAAALGKSKDANLDNLNCISGLDVNLQYYFFVMALRIAIVHHVLLCLKFKLYVQSCFINLFGDLLAHGDEFILQEWGLEMLGWHVENKTRQKKKTQTYNNFIIHSIGLPYKAF